MSARTGTLTAGGAIRYFKPTDPHAVYFVHDRRGKVVYIGCSWNPEKRMKYHRAKAPWRGEIATWTADWYPNKDAARTVERDLIRATQPRFNIQCTDLAPDICMRRRPSVYNVGMAAYRPADPD